MKELSAVVSASEQARSRGVACALATVVEVSGSAYRRPGARMLVTEEGQSTGGVSGGCLEQDVLRRARRAMETGEGALVTYDTTDDDDISVGVGLGCRGVIRVLIEPLTRVGEACHLRLLEELLPRREPAVLATVWRVRGSRPVRVGSRLLLGSGGRIWEDLRDVALVAEVEEDAWDVLRKGKSGNRSVLLSGGEVEVFLEFLRPPVPLVLFGGGPDAIPLAQFAKGMGWHVTVVDGRPSAASRARFPHVDAVHLCRPEQVKEQISLDADTVAVVMTHNYLTDLRLMETLLCSPVRYLGLLGPRSRAERLLGELAQAGVVPTEAQLRRLHAPVGLDLGAENAEEVALSILSEIRAVLAGRSGGMLRERETPIHERARAGEGRRWTALPEAEEAACLALAS